MAVYASFPHWLFCRGKGLGLGETQLAGNNPTSLCPSPVLIAQEKPPGKIYRAMGSPEYFPKGDPGHLACACALRSRSWGARGPGGGAAPAAGPLRTSWVAAAPVPWSAQQLSGGPHGETRGGAVCLGREALTFPHP